MLVMVINRSLTKSALWNGILVVEGEASDGVIEWGDERKGDGEV